MSEVENTNEYFNRNLQGISGTYKVYSPKSENISNESNLLMHIITNYFSLTLRYATA